MARRKGSKTHNVFLLDSPLIKDALSQGNRDSIVEFINEIMHLDRYYIVQQLKDGVDTQGFSILLYFKIEENHKNRFSSFCSAFIKEDQDAVTFIPRNSSSVLFVWNTNHIYAITTGQGYRMVESIALPKFGLIVAGIFGDNFKITSLDSDAMSSIVHSTRTIYSNEVDFTDVTALDIVFKEITGRIKDSTRVRALLNLREDSKRKSVKLMAKNYMQFSSSFNFSGLLHLFSQIDNLNFLDFQDRFNIISPLNTRNNKSEIKSNNDALMHRIYESLKINEPFPFDLFHIDTNQFITADEYVIYNPQTGDDYCSFDDNSDTSQIWNAYNVYLSDKPDTITNFSSFFGSVKLRSIKDDFPVTDAKLLEHISGELRVSNTNYFVFYGKYYQQNSTYTDRLNELLRNRLRDEFFSSEITTEWSFDKDENWFNEAVSVREKYAHLHRVTPDYIEFCDLLKLDNDIVSIVHVKDGFDCNMRSLDRQVELSIAKIIDIRHHNNDTYFRDLYQKASTRSTGTNIAEIFPTIEGFIDCMKTKTVRYLVVIRPNNKNLLDNTSNIAKHCLNALIMRCFQQGFELRIQVV